MSDVSSVTNFFSTANEGFTTTLSSTISAGATTVPLNNTAGLVDGTVFVGIIEPGATAQQVFTGVVNLGSAQISNVAWTRGANVGHASGVTIVDYVTGTGHNMLSAGILKHANQDGTLKNGVVSTASLASGAVTSDKIADGTIATADLADGAVTPGKQASGSGLSYRLGLNTKTSTGDVIPATIYTTYCTVTATSLNKEVEVQYGVNIQDAGSGAPRSGHIRIQVDGVTLSGSDIIWETVNNNFVANPNMIMSHIPAAGSHTWTLQVEADTAAASFAQQCFLRVNQII